MENIVCQLCNLLCEEPVLLQCKHPICSKCVQSQFSSELLRTPCDHFPLNTEHKKKEGKKRIHDEKKTINICCPACNEETILIFSQGDIKLSNNQQLPAENDNELGTNQQQQQRQQYIPDEMFQWMFQFLNAKELFKKICFVCSRLDKIVCTSLHSLHCQGLCIGGLKFAHEALPQESQVQELNLMANNIGDNEATRIATLFPLIQQLQTLNLSWNRIGNLGAIAIANSVKHLKQLQVLDISCNPIEDLSITAISNATKVLTKLQQLQLSENYSKDVHEKMMKVLNNKNETYLRLYCCNIDDASAITVSKMLSYFSQLQGLYLDNNQIGDIGIAAIANSITNLTQLQELNLAGNHIGNTGASAIANSIINLTRLHWLILADNQIGDTGIIALANAISNLTQLQELYFHNNQIGNSGAIAIANSISSLTQLQELHLSGNRIGDAGAVAIVNLISKLPRLNCLYLLNNNNISMPVKQQLKQQYVVLR